MFGSIAKWATQIDDAERLPEIVARAFAVATSGRPGPVVVALPEDMLVREVDVPDARAAPRRSPARGAGRRRHGAAGRAAGAGARAAGRSWGRAAGRRRPAPTSPPSPRPRRVPVAASFRCQDYVDNASPAYAGHAGLAMDPALAKRIREADVLLAIGGRLGEIPTAGYTLVRPGAPTQRLVHVHPDPDEIGAVYPTELGIVAGLEAFAAAARALEPAGAEQRAPGCWRPRAASTSATWPRRASCPAPLQMSAVMATLRDRLPDEAILTNGAGNFSVWAHRYYEFHRYPTQLGPRSGSMGYGVPAAVAAKAVHPDRPVVCIAGDGDFLMTGQELATAVQEELAVVVLVVNNAMYGTIRMHQERHYPGRVVGTDLRNPDFVAYARAFGAHGALVERSEDFPAALDEALGCGRPGGDRAARRPAGHHPAPDARRDPGGRVVKRREVMVEGLAEPISHYADAVVAGDTLYVSGIVPVDAPGALVGGDDVVAQARQVFAIMERVLAAAGATPADVVKVTVYLLDVDDRPLINPVRQEFFGSTRPASTLVEVSRLAVPGARLEIEAIAHLHR